MDGAHVLVGPSLVATRQVTHPVPSFSPSFSLVLFFQLLQQVCFVTGYVAAKLLLQGHAQYFEEASALQCKLLEARVEQLSREKERLEYDRNVWLGPLHTPSHTHTTHGCISRRHHHVRLSSCQMAVHFAQQLPPTAAGSNAGSNAGCSRGTQSVAETTGTHNQPPPATTTATQLDRACAAHSEMGGANGVGAPACAPLSAGMVPARDDAFEARKRALAPPSTTGGSEGWSALSNSLSLMYASMQTADGDKEENHEDRHNAWVAHESVLLHAAPTTTAPHKPAVELAADQQLFDELATAAVEPSGSRGWSPCPSATAASKAVASCGPSELLGKPRKTSSALRREKRHRAALKMAAEQAGVKHERDVAVAMATQIMSQQAACARPACNGASYEEPYGYYYYPTHAQTFGAGDYEYGGGSHYGGGS